MSGKAGESGGYGWRRQEKVEAAAEAARVRPWVLVVDDGKEERRVEGKGNISGDEGRDENGRGRAVCGESEDMVEWCQ